MKHKITVLLLLSALFTTSCGDDDDPSYKWKCLWTETINDANNLTIAESIVVDNIQEKTDKEAQLAVAFDTSILVSVAKEYIIKDEVVRHGDLKSRHIIYKAPTNYLPNPNYPYSYYLYDIKITYQKIQ